MEVILLGAIVVILGAIRYTLGGSAVIEAEEDLPPEDIDPNITEEQAYNLDEEEREWVNKGIKASVNGWGPITDKRRTRIAGTDYIVTTHKDNRTTVIALDPSTRTEWVETECDRDVDEGEIRERVYEKIVNAESNFF